MNIQQEYVSIVDSLLKQANESNNKLTMDDIANKLEMQTTQFSDLYNGKQEVTEDQLSKIKRVFSSEETAQIKPYNPIVLGGGRGSR